jgi:putative membrane protein
MLPAVVSSGAVLLVGAPTLWAVELGPLSSLMAQHLLVMNVIAPLAAAMLADRFAGITGHRWVWVAGFIQIAALWMWHAPQLQRVAAASAVPHMIMLAALAVIATLYWAAVLRAQAQARWHSVGALLLTGKLACLLGGLLIFAPRDLFGLPGLAFGFCRAGPSTLEDQQLAGLLMIAACPLSYVVAGVAMTAQMLLDLGGRPALLRAAPGGWATE